MALMQGIPDMWRNYLFIQGEMGANSISPLPFASFIKLFVTVNSFIVAMVVQATGLWKQPFPSCLLYNSQPLDIVRFDVFPNFFDGFRAENLKDAQESFHFRRNRVRFHKPSSLLHVLPLSTLLLQPWQCYSVVELWKPPFPAFFLYKQYR